MTHKEKAKELVEAFAPYCTYDKDGLVIPVAKQCALIAVEEIMKSYEATNDHNGSVYKYWQHVKEEIKNYTKTYDKNLFNL